MILGPKKGHGDKPAEDLDAWLMTYADMITLLLCFFAIFISISEPSSQKVKQVTEQMRGAFGDVSGIGFGDLEQVGGNTSKESLLTRMNSIIALHPLQKDVSLQQTAKGINIELNSGSFFQSGSAELTEEGKSMLEEIGAEINSAQYMGYLVIVEGHTDDNPIKTERYPSNWELSTNRATNVVKLFIELGMAADRLSAAGYSDTKPKSPNRDSTGLPIPENQAQNRRVMIRLEQN